MAYTESINIFEICTHLRDYIEGYTLDYQTPKFSIIRKPTFENQAKLDELCSRITQLITRTSLEKESSRERLEDTVIGLETLMLRLEKVGKIELSIGLAGKQLLVLNRLKELGHSTQFLTDYRG